MSLTSRAVLSVATVLALLGTAAPANAAAPAPAPSVKAVVDLTYDVIVARAVATLVATDQGGSLAGMQFKPETFTRPTAAPMPPTSPVTELGFKLAPGTTAVVSVFSSQLVNDSACITGTSTETSAVVYLSTLSGRPTSTRPHGCALPGHKPHLIKPSSKVLANERQQVLIGDLRNVSIAEESYATDNNGTYVADTLSRPTKAPLPAQDALVLQGVRLAVGDKVVATLVEGGPFGEGYCLTGTQAKTKQVLYLSSTNDVPTRHRPLGCVAG